VKISNLNHIRLS